MAEQPKDLYRELSENLESVHLSSKSILLPDPTVEGEIPKIFTQASKHRNRLISFYIHYTIVFTIFVFALIFWQAKTRIHLKDTGFELIPSWALNLLVVGMFGQFVGLLTIVTSRVWNFDSFFAYHWRMHNKTEDVKKAVRKIKEKK